MPLLAKVDVSQHFNQDYFKKTAQVAINYHVKSMEVVEDLESRNLMQILIELLLRAKVEGFSGYTVRTAALTMQTLSPTSFQSLQIEQILDNLTQRRWLLKLTNGNFFGYDESEYPVVWYGNWLALSGCFGIEKSLAKQIQTFNKAVQEDSVAQRDSSTVIDTLAGLNKEQKQAVLGASARTFSIITGGPGTGKTTAVTALISLLVDAGVYYDQIALCAPTGKAVQRLGESLANRFAGNQTALDHITQATLHRLLGIRVADLAAVSQRSTELWHYRLIVVDEASMLDNNLLTQLLCKLPQQCKLVLMGDVNQLGPIGIGNPFYAMTQALSKSATDSVAIFTLNQSHRFKESSEIGLLAHQILYGDADEIVEYLIRRELLQSQDNLSSIFLRIQENLHDYSELLLAATSGAITDVDLMQASLQCKILTSHNDGEVGSDQLNQQIDSWLLGRFQKESNQQLAAGYVGQSGDYHGRILMMSENNYQLGLYNGDLGICVWREGQFYFAIPAATNSNDSGSEQSLKYFAMVELKGLKPAYAMTVHKSQGSEFADVLVCLSDVEAHTQQTNFAHVNRRLLYTAVTRAKSSVRIISSTATIRYAMENIEAADTPLLSILENLPSEE